MGWRTSCGINSNASWWVVWCRSGSKISFMEAAVALRASGQDALDSQLAAQREQLMELLDGAQGFNLYKQVAAVCQIPVGALLTRYLPEFSPECYPDGWPVLPEGHQCGCPFIEAGQQCCEGRPLHHGIHQVLRSTAAGDLLSRDASLRRAPQRVWMEIWREGSD